MSQATTLHAFNPRTATRGQAASWHSKLSTRCNDLRQGIDAHLALYLEQGRPKAERKRAQLLLDQAELEAIVVNVSADALVRTVRLRERLPIYGIAWHTIQHELDELHLLVRRRMRTLVDLHRDTWDAPQHVGRLPPPG